MTAQQEADEGALERVPGGGPCPPAGGGPSPRACGSDGTCRATSVPGAAALGLGQCRLGLRGRMRWPLGGRSPGPGPPGRGSPGPAGSQRRGPDAAAPPPPRPDSPRAARPSPGRHIHPPCRGPVPSHGGDATPSSRVTGGRTRRPLCVLRAVPLGATGPGLRVTGACSRYLFPCTSRSWPGLLGAARRGPWGQQAASPSPCQAASVGSQQRRAPRAIGHPGTVLVLKEGGEIPLRSARGTQGPGHLQPGSAQALRGQRSRGAGDSAGCCPPSPSVGNRTVFDDVPLDVAVCARSSPEPRPRGRCTVVGGEGRGDLEGTRAAGSDPGPGARLA